MISQLKLRYRMSRHAVRASSIKYVGPLASVAWAMSRQLSRTSSLQPSRARCQAVGCKHGGAGDAGAGGDGFFRMLLRTCVQHAAVGRDVDVEESRVHNGTGQWQRTTEQAALCISAMDRGGQAVPCNLHRKWSGRSPSAREQDRGRRSHNRRPRGCCLLSRPLSAAG